MVEAAKLLVARHGNGLRIEGVTWDERYEAGAALPGPDATLAGPTFEEWLAVGSPRTPSHGIADAEPKVLP